VAAVLVLNATPGVDLLLAVSRTLQAGRAPAWPRRWASTPGCVVHALAAAFGLAPCWRCRSAFTP
jgi:threonine/homoserine/homoserine lactone efflux protein